MNREKWERILDEAEQNCDCAEANTCTTETEFKEMSDHRSDLWELAEYIRHLEMFR